MATAVMSAFTIKDELGGKTLGEIRGQTFQVGTL